MIKQFDRLRRREFITLLGGAAAWPFAARAQQPLKLPTIGFLGVVNPAAWSKWTAAFVQRLRDLAWIEGRTISIEYRWTEGRAERLPDLAAELARLKVDIIVTAGPAGVFAARKSAPTTPIVFALIGDPLQTGVVSNLAHPEGNVTGLSMQHTDTVGKRLELLREIIPRLTRLAVLANVGWPEAVLEMAEIQSMAKMLSLDITPLEIRRVDDIAPAFGSLKGGQQALYVCVDPLMFAQRIRVNTLAQGVRLPTIYAIRDYVEAGGMLSYGANIPDLFRRAAEYVDKILRGAKPADLPIEQPVKFDLVINVITAKALGIEVPPTLLAAPTR